MSARPVLVAGLAAIALVCLVAALLPRGPDPVPRAALRPASAQVRGGPAPEAAPPAVQAQAAGEAPSAEPAVPLGSTPLPRPSSEWQGMLVDLAVTPYCTESSACGLARACVARACTACRHDSDCATGEGCALDHCVLMTLIECRRRADCGADAACILSGYSDGPRGNRDMKSHCVSSRGGGSPPPDPPPRPADTRTSLPGDDLTRRAHEALGRAGSPVVP